MRSRWLLILGCALAVAGCDGGGGGSKTPSASQTIGAAGGTVRGPDGSAVTVPSDALAAATVITIARDSRDAPRLLDGWRPLGSTYAFTPHGTVFDGLVELAVPYDAGKLPAATAPQFALAEKDGPWTVLTDVSPRGEVLTAPIHSFSTAVVFSEAGQTVPRVKLEIVAPTNLPRDPATGGSLSLPYVTQPTTLTVRATVRQDLFDPANDFYCRDTPTLEFQRLARPSGIGLPAADWPVIATRSTTSAADVDTLVDAAQNGYVYFKVKFDCDWRSAQGKMTSTPPPWYFGYAWAKVNVPTAPGAPTITAQPQDVTTTAGNRASFSVVATAPDTLSIQWQRSNDGGASWTTLQTGSDATYTLTTSMSDNGAHFRANVCNSLGVQLTCVVSDTATLTVTPAGSDAPTFSQQPADNAVLSGAAASFSATATGTPAPEIQWYRAGSPDTAVGSPCAPGSGATTCGYTTAALSLTDTGAQFFARATNAGGSVDSSYATVTVTGSPIAPTIVTEPRDLDLLEGEHASFSVVASGTSPLTYDWQRDFTSLGAPSAPTLDFGAVTLADSGATFMVTVGNAGGSIDSRAATLTVSSRPVQTGGCVGGNTADWCWIRPTPQGNALQTVAFDGTSTVALGNAGTVVSSADDGANWAASFAAQDRYRWYDAVSPTPGVLLGAGTLERYDAQGNAVRQSTGVYRSTDGGASWMNVLAESVTTLAFVDPQVGVAFGQAISRTTNGGQSWQPVSQLPSGVNEITRIATVDADTFVGVGVGSEGGCGSCSVVMRSTDRGQTWTVSAVPAVSQFGDVAFGEASVGLAVGLYGEVYRSVDGGVAWSSVALPPASANDPPARVAFADATTALLIGTNGFSVMRSVDGGATFEDPTYPWVGSRQISRVSFRDFGYGVAVGDYGFASRSLDGGQSWLSLTGGSNDDSLEALAFSGTGVALASGYSRAVQRSTDGGVTWTAIPVGGSTYLDATFATPTDVFLAGRYGDVVASRDAGLTWGTVYPHNDPSDGFFGIGFASATVGVAVGVGGIALRTVDGGATWNTVSSGTTATLLDVTFRDANNGFAVGADHTLLATSDAGATWQSVTLTPVLPSDQYRRVVFATSQIGFIVTDTGLFRTANGGGTWADVYRTSRGSALDVRFAADASHGVVTGVNGEIAVTTNGGVSWTRIDKPIGVSLFGVGWADATTVVAVGDGGAILRNTNGGN